MKQSGFSALAYEQKKKMTRKERFLAETVSYIAMAEAFAKDITFY